MSFTRKQGKTKFMWLPMTASTTCTKGDLMTFDDVQLDGTIRSADSGMPPIQIIGVIRHTIASTDDDYATARLVEVEVPVENYVVWEATVTASLVVADVGLFCDITNAGTVDRSSSAKDIVQCVKFITTTKGWFVLNTGVAGFGAVGAA